MERKKKRAASPEELATLTVPRKENSFPQVKQNRLKKQEKLIQMNKRYFFYFDQDGHVRYKLKKGMSR